MSTITQHGYLVLADISGYTSFVAKTELEHSHEILTELLELLVERFRRGIFKGTPIQHHFDKAVESAARTAGEEFGKSKGNDCGQDPTPTPSFC
jgi:hypothetical protein